MKTDITYGKQHIIIDSSDEVHFVGVSVKRRNTNFSLVTGCENAGAIRKDVTVILDNDTKVILHNYSSPELSEMVKELYPFAGMKFSKIRFENFYLFQTI